VIESRVRIARRVGGVNRLRPCSGRQPDLIAMAKTLLGNGTITLAQFDRIKQKALALDRARCEPRTSLAERTTSYGGRC
jgi:hypothetical protein